MSVMVSVSCEKTDSPPEGKKIQDIIPAVYLQSLREYGMELHEGLNPPHLEGTYLIDPVTLAQSNVSGDFSPGWKFTAAGLNLSQQQEDDLGISLKAKHFLAAFSENQGITTAVSGSGNSFTVYGTVEVTDNFGNLAIYATIISGTKDGNQLKDVKWGLICIDDSKGGGRFLKKGEGRVLYDGDFVSEHISSLDAF